LLFVWRWLLDLAETLLIIKPDQKLKLLTIPFDFQSSIRDLAKSAELHATVTENLAGAVIIRNKNGRITYCNPYSKVLLGLTREELINSEKDPIEEITNEKDRPIYQKAHMLSLIGEPFQYRQQYRHTSGIDMWAETRVTPLLNEHGDVTATLSIMIDITHQIKTQNQLSLINSELTDFNYMISHDLRTPLVTIRGGIAMISSVVNEHGSNEQKKMFEHLQHACQRLHTLTESVIEYGKINSSVFEKIPLDPLPIIEQAIQIYANRIEESRAEISVPAYLPRVFASPLPVSQIIGNLIENALKYSHPERVPQIKISSQIDEICHELIITVTDNGIGIAPENYERIFRPFQRIQGNNNGSGVGLACVKKLIEKIEGSITVQSIPEEGTTFTIRLPLHEETKHRDEKCQ
jgi:PAS domain S-box-containing protein